MKLLWGMGVIGWALAADALAQVAPVDAGLSPAGRWTAEYNDGDCTLSRSFGSAASPTMFVFRPTPDMAGGELFLIAPGDATVRRGQGRVTMRPSGQKVVVRWVSGPLKSGDLHGVRFDADQSFWDELPTTTGLDLDVGERSPVRLNLGSMAAPLSAAKTCGEDLMRHWNIDPTAVVKPAPDEVSRIFGSDDYPVDALRMGQQGRVVAVSTIDPTGRATACTVVKTSGSEALDRTTCSVVLASGRFGKAASDTPAKRFVFLSIRWEIP